MSSIISSAGVLVVGLAAVPIWPLLLFLRVLRERRDDQYPSAKFPTALTLGTLGIGTTLSVLSSSLSTRSVFYVACLVLIVANRALLSRKETADAFKIAKRQAHRLHLLLHAILIATALATVLEIVDPISVEKLGTPSVPSVGFPLVFPFWFSKDALSFVIWACWNLASGVFFVNAALYFGIRPNSDRYCRGGPMLLAGKFILPPVLGILLTTLLMIVSEALFSTFLLSIPSIGAVNQVEPAMASLLGLSLYLLFLRSCAETRFGGGR